jgi:hypothetical protein
MTVTLTFKPDEVEAELLDQARTTGMTVEEYLLSMVEGIVPPGTPNTLSPEQRAAAFEAWSANHRVTPPSPTTPSAVKPCTKAATADARPG